MRSIANWSNIMSKLNVVYTPMCEISICFVQNYNYHHLCCKKRKKINKREKNPNYLKFSEEVLVAIEISMLKISKLVILFFKPKKAIAKTSSYF